MGVTPMQGRSNRVRLTWRSRNRGRMSSARAARRIVPAVEPCEERTLLSLSVGTNFSATGFPNSGFIPPDTQGAAGPTQLVEIINGAFAVYSKTGTLMSRTTLDSFFNTALAAGGGGS